MTQDSLNMNVYSKMHLKVTNSLVIQRQRFPVIAGMLKIQFNVIKKNLYGKKNKLQSINM